ncbi:MAG: porin [Phycisphaerales bacterium]
MLAAVSLGVATAVLGAGPGSAQDSDEVRALVAEVLADAEARSSLLRSSGSGHDGGFHIEDPEGAFRLNIGGLIQFRYTYNHIEDEGPDYIDDESGFEVARARLWFSGRVHEDIGYYVRAQFSGTTPEPGFTDRTLTGVAELDRAYMDFALRDGLHLRAGQMVSDLTRENEHSPDSQLAAAPSPTDSVFNTGAFTGLQFRAFGEDTRAYLELGMGARGARRSFDDSRSADYSLSLKVDRRLAGDWARFGEFTSFPGSDFAAKIGVGAHWENGAEVTDPGVDLSIFFGVMEISLEGDGWNAFTALHYSRNDYEGDGLDDYGFVVQGGAFFDDHNELFARFDAVFDDDDRAAGGNGDFRTLAVGWNNYPVAGTTAVRFTVDAQWFFDAESDSLVNPSTNLAIRASAEPDQFAVRAQVSLRF